MAPLEAVTVRFDQRPHSMRRYQERDPAGDLSGMEILGYDPVMKTYTDNGFDSSGQANSGTWTVSGDTWSYVADRMPGGMWQRCVLTFGAGSITFTVTCDTSPDRRAGTTNFEGSWKKSGRTP
jgi:hypothetical protein